jgi:hypothetical protein
MGITPRRDQVNPLSPGAAGATCQGPGRQGSGLRVYMPHNLIRAGVPYTHTCTVAHRGAAGEGRSGRTRRTEAGMSIEIAMTSILGNHLKWGFRTSTWEGRSALLSASQNSSQMRIACGRVPEGFDWRRAPGFSVCLRTADGWAQPHGGGRMTGRVKGHGTPMGGG